MQLRHPSSEDQRRLCQWIPCGSELDTLQSCAFRWAEADSWNLQYDLKQPHPVMGAAMEIKLDPATALAKGSELTVKVDYTTTPECTAIGWLEKE